jgi:hypothetical protein
LALDFGLGFELLFFIEACGSGMETISRLIGKYSRFRSTLRVK